MPMHSGLPNNTAYDWEQILEHYVSLNDRPYGRAMEELVRSLEAKGYVGAGLRGTTSMFDLLLALATDVFNNPHLRISPGLEGAKLIFRDGSNPEWSVQVSYDELIERVERFLLKRARWFRNHETPRMA